MTYVLVAIFGAAGAVSRYWVDGRISDLTHGQFPWGTFVINVVGAFALGNLIADVKSESTAFVKHGGK